MHKRLALALLLPCAAALFASCGVFDPPGYHVDDTTFQHGASGFRLHVLPETYTAAGLEGGSADFQLTATPSGNSMAVSLSASGASHLRGILCGIEYDPLRWTPAEVADGAALKACGESVSLSITDQPGTVWHGEVLARPEGQAGLSGSGELLRLRFAPAAGHGGAVKQAAAAPTSDLSRTFPVIEGTVLSWAYYNQGDYDQNSEVNISDLTPIAVRLGASTGGTGPFQALTLESVTDGDNNGEVNISDLTPIGVNFGRVVASYSIYLSTDPESEYPASNGAPSVIPPAGNISYNSFTGDAKTGRIGYSYDLTALTDNAVYWVRPSDGTAEGTPSAQALVDNLPPVINSVSGNPLTIDALGTSSLNVDATDPDGDPLTYVWTPTGGSITGSGASVTYNAPNVVLDTVFTVTIEVQDGKGGSASDEVDITVKAPPPNNAPVINSISCNPDPALAGGDATLSADVTDADGDPLNFNWEVALGSVTNNLDDTGTWTAPSVVVDTLVTVSLTVNDGKGGVAQDSIDVTVHYEPEDLDHIELDDIDTLSGSGTELDPYLIDGDPGSELQVQFKAVGSQGNDMTALCAWAETSTAPGTGFSISNLGLLFVSPFDNEFSVNAVFNTTISNDIYFKVVPPS